MKKKQKVKRGRKPIEDKKIHVPLYVPKSQVETLGGIDEVRNVAYPAIEQKAEETKTDNP